MTTTVKQVFGALAALVLSSTAAVADATFNGITYVDLTTDGAGTASSTNAAYSGYSMPGCFDNSWADSADRGMCGYTTTYPAMYVDYAFNTATTVNAYSVRNAGTGGSNQTTRAPNTWTFEGSDDGVTWTQLDARTNETGWASAEIRLYKFVNTHAYKQYRYSCTANNGGNCFQVHEIEFYNTTAPLVTSSFSKKLVFTVAGHTGSEDLQHFPVLVRLSTAINGFDYADCGTGGAGLRFADADGNLLHHEIDTWNTAGESLVWVDMPHCRANETFTLYLAADDPAALQTVYPTEVWDNAGVQAVWHMNELMVDSSTHAYTGWANYNNNAGSITSGGVVGSEIDMVSGYGYRIASDGAWAGYSAGGPVAFSAWVSRQTADSGIERYVFATANNIKLTSTSTDSSYTWKVSNGATALITETTAADVTDWTHVAVVAADGAIRLYVDGSLAGTSNTALPATPGNFFIAAQNKSGDYRWKGYMDEVRIHRGAESAEYVQASYATVASAGFLTNTGVQNTGAILPLAVRADQATLSGTTATITGRLSNLGTGATEADVMLYYSTTSDVESGTVAGTTNLTAAADLSDTLAGLTAGTTYYYAYKAVNNLSATAWSATNSFTVEAATVFSDTLEIETLNCQMTVTGTMTEWGLGTTEVELLVGASADNLETVQTVNLAAAPANMEVAFDPFTKPVGTYIVKIRATTTYGNNVWVRETVAAEQAVADASTYTWKGGAGSWSDPAMWTSSDAGAAGVPSEASSVVFGDADSSIELSSSPTVANLTVSSVGKHEFRSNWMTSLRTLTVSGTVAFSGAGGGTLVFDSVGVSKDFIDLGGIKNLVIENYGSLAVMHAAAGANGDFSGTDVTLVNGGTLKIKGFNKKVFSFGKLTAIGGPCVVDRPQNYLVTATFASFEARTGSGVPVVTVPNELVSFTDTTGIEMVGGTDTLAAPGPRIPVCTQFQLETDKAPGLGFGVCTLDGGTIKEIPVETMLDSFEGATDLDNVCITNATTVSADVTVNAVLFGRVNCDLGGHTITVNSGICREQYKGATWSVNVTNGTFRLARPTDFCNGSEGGMNADYATIGNEDVMKPILSLTSGTTKYPTKPMYADFTGLFSMTRGGTFTLKAGIAATNAVLEMRGGSLIADDHTKRYAFRGLAGVSTWTHLKWNPFLYLGVPDGDEYWTDTTKKAMVVVGDKGVLAPGVVGYDGGRRGCIVLSYHAYLTDLVFRDGAELQVALHDDGTSSYVDLTETSSAGSYIDVTLAGTISVATTKKVPMGVKYPVIKYQQGKLTGRFANVTQGFKVQYDVLQPDGAYAVTVERKNVGTFIIIR